MLKGPLMGLLDYLRGRPSRQHGTAGPRFVSLGVERLEPRDLLDATATLASGLLTVNGGPGAYDRLALTLDPSTNQIVLQEFGVVRAAFASAAVSSITINAQAHNNLVRIDPAVTQPAKINGAPGVNFLRAGGGAALLVGNTGVNRLEGGPANDSLIGGAGANTFAGNGGQNQLVGGPGTNFFFGTHGQDTVLSSDPVHDHIFLCNPSATAGLDQFLGLTPSAPDTLDATEVNTLLQRAAAATASDDGIVAIVDRGGRVLGVRVEGNVSPAITGNVHNLVFAIDGAIAEARTGAFFGNGGAPLTSRTIQFISQTTITQREVESDPSILDVNSPFRGPGFVAPIGIGGHFPPGVPFTPQVDLFAIEHTNRDTTFHPGPSGIAGGPDSVFLPQRFNVDPAFIPASIPANQQLEPPDSYGFLSGLESMAQPRGIGTLPGGIPILKTLKPGGPAEVVGGIGVFFPGTTGFADEENSSLGATFNPAKRDRSLEAEYVAFAALGGSGPTPDGTTPAFPIGTLGGVAPLPEIVLPNGRIDLVGITLPLFGPTGTNGPATLVQFGQGLGIGDPNSGFDAPLLQPNMFGRVIQQNAAGTPILGPNGLPLLVTTDVGGTPAVGPGGLAQLVATGAKGNLLGGTVVPEGFLVTPHDGVGITAAQVLQIIDAGVQQALETRAAIRLPESVSTAMVFAVTDETGAILGLFRMPDATIFSIDVAVAKARNVAYYANPAQLQPIDQAPGVPAGAAFTNRTFRFLSEPFFPEGINGTPPAPFSILNDGGADTSDGVLNGPRLPSSAFQTVMGHDAFFPQTNFRDPFNILNQNGIVFFPGSSPLYGGGFLLGGFGVSGDGVDQDDVVTAAGAASLAVPDNLRADQFFVSGIRLPFQKFNRQPILP
jgi:uncharacterized protein GlcG (DUF336 family)